MMLAAGAVVLLVLTVVAGSLFRRLERRKLHALFSGQEVFSRGRPTGFIPQIEYDLTAYANISDERIDSRTSQVFVPDPRTALREFPNVLAPSVYKERLACEFLTVTYPKDEALFPPNLCAPFVEWSDVNNNLWQVTVAMPERSRKWVMLSRTRRWRIPENVWREIVESAGASVVALQVRGVERVGLWGKTRDEVHVSGKVSFRISKDPADNVVIYRLIDPPFINRKTPDIFVRELRGLRPAPFICMRREYCINCHTFSSQTGRRGKLAIQVRYGGKEPHYPRIYLALLDLETREVVKPVMPFTPQGTTFMAWSPDGTKLALAGKHLVSATRPQVHGSLPTLQANADIAVYDVETGKVLLLPGASEKGVLEVYPHWTPDGKSIVFSAAPGGLESKLTHLNLHVIPYADGRGGKAKPVPGASNNGRSNYFPRFSPDGKWLSFVQSDGGSFIKSSSDIYLMPATLEGRARALESNDPLAADSWYCWSSNSRWIVFTSKRDDGAFARLYFTHIDGEGHASEPVRLPIANEMRMSFNIPEFVTDVPTIDGRALFEGLRVERQTLPIAWSDGRKHD